MSNHTPIQIPLAIEGATVEVPLSKGFVAVIDAIDADLAFYHWRAARMDGYHYAVRGTVIEGRKVIVYMHRIILERMIGRELRRDEYTDHINGSAADNRRQNLRAVTHAQNMRNRKTASNNQSGLKGVYKHKRRWRARITANGKVIRLGSFTTPEAAHEAYCRAARQYHGEYANTGD